MFKRLNNWHLSVLIIIVSVLSLLLIDRHVLAQWSPPSAAPGGAALAGHIVVTPMSEGLDLRGYTITDPLTDATFSINPAGPVGITTKGASFNGNVTILNSNELCFDGDCRDWAELEAGIPDDTDWTENKSNVYRLSGNVGIGLTAPDYKLHIYDGTYNLKFDGNEILHSDKSPLYIRSAGDIKFEPDAATTQVTFKNSGYVGIGTENPNKNLHVFGEGVNAEIDIQSGALLTHWGIYQDKDTADLFFWNSSNRVVFTSDGKVGINKTSPSATLDVEGDGAHAIHGESGNATYYGVFGENSVSGGIGVMGQGYAGVKGEATLANGYGVYGDQGSGAYAGYFEGTLRITNNGAQTGWLQINVVNTEPAASDCDSDSETGRMIYVDSTNQLFICDYDYSGGGGGHWRFEDYVESVPL